jgi:hypothetical protein
MCGKLTQFINGLIVVSFYGNAVYEDDLGAVLKFKPRRVATVAHGNVDCLGIILGLLSERSAATNRFRLKY